MCEKKVRYGKGQMDSEDEKSYRERTEMERESRVARFERFLTAEKDEKSDEASDGKVKIPSESAKTENSARFRNNKKEKDDKPSDANIHKGHRKRMRESARRDPELESFSDVQILEYLLAFATPQRDTNPTAHALLDKFGSLLAVFRAPVEELINVKGVTVAAAEIISMLVKICIWDGKRDIRLSSAKSVASYFGSMFLPGENVGVCVAYLDTGFELIAFEQFDYSALELKAIVGAACRHGARFVLMSMRHDNFPDMRGISESVDSLAYALKLVGIKFLDCLMFTEYGFYTRGNVADPDGVEFVFYPYQSFVGSAELVSKSIGKGETVPVSADIDIEAFVRGTAFERQFALAEVAAEKDE